MSRRLATAGVVGVAALACVLGAGSASASVHGGAHGPLSYAVGTPVVDQVSGGPWTLSQGDPAFGSTVTVDGVGYPNAAVDPSGTGAVPAQSGVTGTPGPLTGYCSQDNGTGPATGSVLRQPVGTKLAMQPYYFPYVTSDDGGRTLTGYFDYRPKDTDEAVVTAVSHDHGKTWYYTGEALEQNAGLCADGNTNDDGQGHAFVLKVPDYAGTGKSGQVLYTLSRPSGDNPGVNLIVHELTPKGDDPLAGLPATEPVGMGGSTTATAAVSVPAGPTGDGVTIAVGSTANFEQPGHFDVDGHIVDCNDDSATATAFTGCTTRDGAGVSIGAGDAVTADSVIPADAQQTSGLISPDGIVSTLPHFKGAPKGSVAVLYTEKIVDYYAPTTTTAAVTLPAATVPVADTSALTLTNGSIETYLGTAAGIQDVTCTGLTATSLTGCTGGTGSVAKGSDLGAPGAAIAPYAQLALTGEGKNKPKSLYGNNEDYTVARVAYTYDGLHFTDLGQVSGLNDPASNSSTELRWIGSRGTVITNPDGSYGLFLSGAYAADGDSDAFNQIFYSSSRDGIDWSAPQKLIGTDDTFSALQQQTVNGGALGITGYYSGRTYDPTVVQNANGTLTMVFAGYSTPKPLPVTGSVVGTNPNALYTVPAAQAAEYRTILSVTLKPVWTCSR
ncbi:MAG TPA: hypothetical protein VFN97_22735 [Actinospica sp.]|nr:hypothetical protein [Actinospica sp.]